MLSRKEMMERLAMASDVELEGALRSIEIQREIEKEVSKSKEENFEENKCHLSEIDVTCLIRLKAENMEDLLKDVTRFQNQMKDPDVSKFVSLREMEIKKWNGMGVSACNMTIDYKVNKEDIEDLNKKMFKFF
nr:MAG TPA: hypothetical protein [Caudoviricetes sp.]